MKIKFSKKEKNFKKENLKGNVGFYWKLAVFLMFIAILLSSFLGYYLFVQINKEPVFSTNDSESKVKKINKERIEKVLEYFSLREQKSNQILYSPSPAIDPSL